MCFNSPHYAATTGIKPLFGGVSLVNPSPISVTKATGNYRDDNHDDHHQCGNKCFT